MAGGGGEGGRGCAGEGGDEGDEERGGGRGVGEEVAGGGGYYFETRAEERQGHHALGLYIHLQYTICITVIHCTIPSDSTGTFPHIFLPRSKEG